MDGHASREGVHTKSMAVGRDRKFTKPDDVPPLAFWRREVMSEVIQAAERLRLDDAIAFQNAVDVMFFSKMINTASRHWKCQKKVVDIPSQEALRRCLALMEAIMTDKIVIEESRAGSQQ